MRKNNREFIEEVYLRSENAISKKKTRIKLIVSATCLALLVLVVPMQFMQMLGGASGGSSAPPGEMNGTGDGQQEWNDDVGDGNDTDSMNQAGLGCNSPDETEDETNGVSGEMSSGMTPDEETETGDTETEGTDTEMETDSILEEDEDE